VQLTRSPYPSLNGFFIIEAIADDLEQQLQARLSEDSDRPATPSAAFYPSDEPGESLAYHTLLADPDLHRNDCRDDDDDDDDEEEFVYDPAQRHAPGATARDNARGGRGDDGDDDDDDDDGEIDSDSDALSPRVAVEAVASELHDEDNRSSTTTTNTTLTPRSTSFSSLLSDGRESGEQPQRASSRSRRKAAGEQQRIMLPQVPRNSHIESQSPIANRVACRPRSILSRWHRHYSRIERASYPLSTPLIQASGSSQSISYAYRLSCLCIHVLVLVDVRVGVVSLPIPTRAHSHSKIEYL